jgi:hypothetical protein
LLEVILNEDQQWKALVQLRRNMAKRMSDAELRDLCFDLQVEYEDLAGEGKSDKVRELLSFLVRRQRIPQLIEVGSQLRPDIPWPSAAAAAPAAETAPAQPMVDRLQETRANLLSDLYSQIIEVAEDLRSWAYKDMPIGLSPAEVNEVEIIAQVRELSRLASKARIYLAAETRQRLDAVLDELQITRQELERREIVPDEEVRWEAHVAALDRLFDTIPPAVERLEAEIRQVLGVA